MVRQVQHVNILLGGWLVASAFVWQHSEEQFVNTVVTGIACWVVSVLTGLAPRLRLVNTGLAVWLLVSAFLLRRVDDATAWHNTVVAVAIVMVSLWPVAPQDERGRVARARG